MEKIDTQTAVEVQASGAIMRTELPASFRTSDGSQSWTERLLITENVLYAQIFASEATRGLVVASLPAYLTLVGATSADTISARTSISIAISLFSIGRLLAATPFGYWVDRSASTRTVLETASWITIAATAVYALSGWIFGGAGIVALLFIWVSRFVSGFGSGTIGITRAYLANHSPVEERTLVLSRAALAQYAGFTISPSIAILLNTIASAFVVDDSSLIYLAVIPSLIASALSLLVLYNIRRLPRLDPCTQTLTDGAGQVSKRSGAMQIDKAFAVFFALNLILRGVIGVAETYAADEYQYLNSEHSDAVQDSQKMLLGLGILGVGTFLAIPALEKRFGLPKILYAGMAVTALGSLLMLPGVQGDSKVTFGSGLLLIWSIGSPICQTLTISAYSKMLKAKPQAIAMSWLTTAGSIGRILFPLLVGINITVAQIVDMMGCLVCGVLYAWITQ